MLSVVAPVLQINVLRPFALSLTESPWQKEVGPEAVMVGWFGVAFTVITTPAEESEKQLELLPIRTLYVPEVFTFMLWVVAPVLH
jgi:hypothetical protein